MAVDLAALERATIGDPEAKVSVKRKWLTEVHKELKRLETIKTKHALGDKIAEIGLKMGAFGGRGYPNL